MDNRKKKQTLSRSGHRTGTRTPGTHSVRSTTKKRNTRQPGHSEHISQNRRSSPLTPDSLRATVPLPGETAPASGRLADPGTFRATDSGVLISSGSGTIRPAGPGALRSTGSEALYSAGPLPAEPYKPSSSYAETLVTDAELEAFLSQAVQDMIPDIGSGDRSAFNESVLNESALDRSALNESALNESALNESALNESALDQNIRERNPENNYPSPALQSQFSASENLLKTDDSTYEKSPAASSGNLHSVGRPIGDNLYGDQTGKSGLSPEVHIPADTDFHSSADSDLHLQGQAKISAAGKKARNRALSQIAASLSETGSTRVSAGGFEPSPGRVPSSTDGFQPSAGRGPVSPGRMPSSTDDFQPSPGRVPSSTGRNRITGRNIESTGNTASRIRTGSSILAADNIESSKKTRESLFEEGREQLNRVPASTTVRVSGSEDVLPENKKMSGEKPDSGLTVKKIFSALLTLAGAAACVLIVHYFHMRSVGITPEIGVFSALAGQALESDRAEQEEPADESGAQDAPAGDDQPSDSADPSASDVQDETDAAGSDQDVSAGSPDQPVPDGEEATGFDPASDPASLYPASRDPVSPVPSTPDQAYSDPAYSDPAYTDPASQDPASYDPASLDPAYANQEADQEIDPDDESDWDSFEEEPEDETEWNTIEEDDPDWNDEDYPEEDMDEEDEEYED